MQVAKQAQAPVDELTWTQGARCKDIDDPEAFFERGLARARPAIRICQRCPVKEPCLAYAIDNDIDFGVWGGLTERQRRAHRRRLGLAS